MSQLGRYGAAHRNDASGSQQQQTVPTPTNISNIALPVIRELILGWLQSFLDVMAAYQNLNIPGIMAPYDGYPLPQGFPFPSPIRRGFNQPNLLLDDVLRLLPLLSHRVDPLNARTAAQVRARNFSVVFVQSDIFHWVEELPNRDGQINWRFKAYLVIHGYPTQRRSPLRWELRWGTIILGAFELDRSLLE
ncbi:hypothetical protein BT96DRAFT_2740 [Gymnopus androsaceus JB14]|uniref:Uncharacterized protein n=1 Tax=Gymnopus androsaceus JB14 TaxID=1447944 RepID=A0A6A4IPF7_9AGAR|nr:hypothetical protein BT96DRAFT_2740 [Gymnopus androsaceus JB14]